MVIYFSTLERVLRGAFNGIRVRSRTTRDEISNAAVLMALVVVHVSGENDNARAEVLLPGFQRFGQFLLWGARGVSSPEHFGIRRARVGRMVKNNENEVHIARNMRELLGEPLPLRAG